MSAPRIDNYFVGIGAQKAGTTWLARMLAGHPEVRVTPIKEIHYFDHVRGITEHLSDRKRSSRYRKYHQRLWTQWSRFGEHRADWSWYRRYMADPIDDAWYASLFTLRDRQRIAGEITPEYAIIGGEGLAHIQRLAPQARVIFIMRNPVDRTWSQVLHQCRARGLDASRLAADEIIGLISEPRFGELGDYAQTLDDVAAVFPHAQTLILFYEDMHRDRLKALEAVCQFLGVSFDPAHFGELGRRYNRSQDAALPPIVRAHLRDLYRAQALAVRDRVGRIPPAWEREFSLEPASPGAS